MRLMHLKIDSMKTFLKFSSFSSPIVTSFTNLPSTDHAVPRQQAHGKFRSEVRGPFRPLHFLCTHCLQPPHLIAFLPTPTWHTPQGYFPDFLNTSRFEPETISFVLTILTLNPFISISNLHVYKKCMLSFKNFSR